MFSANMVSWHLGESFCCKYSPFIVVAIEIFASSHFSAMCYAQAAARQAAQDAEEKKRSGANKLTRRECISLFPSDLSRLSPVSRRPGKHHWWVRHYRTCWNSLHTRSWRCLKAGKRLRFPHPGKQSISRNSDGPRLEPNTPCQIALGSSAWKMSKSKSEPIFSQSTQNQKSGFLDFGLLILDFWILDFWIFGFLVFVLSYGSSKQGRLDFGIWISDFWFWILQFLPTFGFCIGIYMTTPTRVGRFFI